MSQQSSPAPNNNSVAQAWSWLKGKKTYIGLAVGAAVVVAKHFGVPLPSGIDAQVNDQEFWLNMYKLALGAAARHGIG